jgi:hypothetical protein
MTSTDVRFFDLNIERFLDAWRISDAIRELIANALDEQFLSQSAEVKIYKDSDGAWHVRDFGRGLRYEHLTQNENAEKVQSSDKVIGRFGVGLKDALATLHRHDIPVSLRSQFADISLSSASKHGFEDVVTLHASIAPPTNPSMIGTDITLCDLADDEIDRAKASFLRFVGERVLETTDYGDVLKRAAARQATIYVNGMAVAEEERFLFSYNITSPTAAIRRALNRERTNVGRSAYADRVKSILLSSSAVEVAAMLADDVAAIELGTSHDEVAWVDVATRACKLLNSRGGTVFVSAAELEAQSSLVDLARKDGYRLVTVPESIREKLREEVDLQGQPVMDIDTYRKVWSDSFEFEFVPEDQLSTSERAVFRGWVELAELVGGLPSEVEDIAISETMRPGVVDECGVDGLWEPRARRIIIRRSELCSIERFGGTFLHELVHAQTGLPDCSREFESALTGTIGCLADKAMANRLGVATARESASEVSGATRDGQASCHEDANTARHVEDPGDGGEERPQGESDNATNGDDLFKELTAIMLRFGSLLAEIGTEGNAIVSEWEETGNKAGDIGDDAAWRLARAFRRIAKEMGGVNENYETAWGVAHSTLQCMLASGEVESATTVEAKAKLVKMEAAMLESCTTLDRSLVTLLGTLKSLSKSCDRALESIIEEVRAFGERGRRGIRALIDCVQERT